MAPGSGARHSHRRRVKGAPPGIRTRYPPAEFKRPVVGTRRALCRRSQERCTTALGDRNLSKHAI